MAKRILVIEDDPIFRCVVRDNLLFDGYQVDDVATARAALSRVRDCPPDLILLDLTLPDGHGFELCPQLRAGSKVPIIILSARGQKVDKIRGLKLGADDYLTKPIDMDELLARIRAMLRRAQPSVNLALVGRLLIDFRKRIATCGSTRVRLTHRELELLRYLAERPGKVVHRDELLREVWGHLEGTVMTRAVDQMILRLRKKIEPDPHHPEFLHTAHRDGYSLSLEDRS